MFRRTILVVAAWGFGGTAWAQDVEPENKPAPAARSAEAGEFLPFTLSSRVDSQRAFVTTLGGYDSGRSTGLLQGQTEVNVWGPIAIRAGAVYTEQTGTLKPTFGAHVQVLKQAKHGLDGSVAVFYKPEGLTEGEGEIETFVTVGRQFGRVGVFGNLTYGQDPEGAERDGEVHVSGLYRLKENVHAGMETRLRFDLFSDNQLARRAKLEANWDFIAAPTVSWSIGQFALIAEGGVSLVNLTAGGSTSKGGIGLAGVGAVF